MNRPNAIIEVGRILSSRTYDGHSADNIRIVTKKSKMAINPRLVVELRGKPLFLKESNPLHTEYANLPRVASVPKISSAISTQYTLHECD